MPKSFDTTDIPYLFSPHEDGEFDKFFSADHSKIIAETSKNIIASLSESRDWLSGKLCYEFRYNQHRYKLTLMKFADTIVRADVTIKLLKSRIMALYMENRELHKEIAEMERRMKIEHRI